MEHKDQPHIRFLNAIPLRTSDEQTSHNSFQAEVQHFARQVPGFGKKKKRITSVRAALREGVAPSAEVEKLLLEKVEAKKKGDKKALRNIRKTLRKLGYKRYKEEHEVEKQTT